VRETSQCLGKVNTDERFDSFLSLRKSHPARRLKSGHLGKNKTKRTRKEKEGKETGGAGKASIK